MVVRISVVDAQWPGHMPGLVRAVERMGFYRYWLTEHHEPGLSASPTLMVGIAAGLSERIRVGAAGVMLGIAPAARVAQDFALLHLFYPGRIDLGVVSALPIGECRAVYEPDVVIAGAGAYVERLQRLLGLLQSRISTSWQETHSDGSQEGLEVWLCGTSVESARLAGSLGLKFAFHHWVSTRQRHDPEPDVGPVHAYRDAFVPRTVGALPYVAVAAYGACAKSGETAKIEWSTLFAGRNSALPSFVGNPDECVTSLSGLAQQYEADEIVIDCLGSSVRGRTAALGLVASAWWSRGPISLGAPAMERRGPSASLR